jgi:hypothetical protein
MVGPSGVQHVSKNHFAVFAPNNKGGVIYAATAEGMIYGITLTTKAGNIGEVALSHGTLPPLAMAK